MAQKTPSAQPGRSFAFPMKDYDSPLRLLTMLAAAVFVAEALVMVLLSYLPAPLGQARILVDPLLLIALVSPLLYIYLLRPLALQVAERQHAEAELRKSNEVLERLFSITHVLYAYLDADFNFIRVNRTYAEVGGHEPEYFAGKNHFELYPHEENEAIFRKVVETRQPYFAYEKPFTYLEFPERGVTYWDWSLLPIQEANGEVSGLILGVIDVTERKKAQLALVESERRFKAIFNQTFQFTGLLKPDGTVLESNQTTLDFGDLERSEVVGKPLWETYGWGQSEDARQRLQAAVSEAAQGRFIRQEIELTGASGEKIAVDFSLKPIFDDAGQVVLLISEGRDISKRKRAEEALRRAHEQLEIRVQERTAELAQLNLSLQEEIRRRKRSEERLRKALEASRQSQAEVTALLKATRAVLEHRNFKEAARAIFESCKMLVEAKAGYIALLNSEGNNEIAFLDSGGASCRVDPTLPMPIRGLRGEVYRYGRTIYENDFSSTGWAKLLPAGHARLENVLFAPLTIKGVVVGALGLANKVNGFNEKDARMATAFGEIAAIALLNSRAEESLRISRDELEIRVWERTQELAKANEELRAEVAERRRVEAQLRLQTTALESAANGVIITDRQGNIQWANPAFSAMTGYDPADALGQPPRILKSGVHPPEFYQRLWQTILAGEVWRGEITNRKKDGNLYTEEQTITPVLDENGEVTHFIAIKQDVSERKRAEQLLRENEALLRKVIETMPVGVWLIDEKGQIVKGNPAIHQIWGGGWYVGPEGYSEYKGWRLDSGQAILPEEWSAARAIQKGEASLNEEIEIESFEGERKVILSSAVPIRDAQEAVIGAIVVNQDITERKKAEALLEQKNRELLSLSAQERNQRVLAEGLVQATIALNKSLDLELVLDRILEQIQNVFHYRAADILLREGDALYVARYRGYDDMPQARQALKGSFSLEDFPLLEAMSESRRSLAIGNTQEDSRWVELPGMEWVRSYSAAPLLLGEQVIGFINLTSDQPDFFDEETCERLMAFAVHATLAIHNARLYEGESHARKSAETLRSASLALTQAGLDLDTILNTVLDYLERLVSYDSAAIVLLDERANLAVRAQRGLRLDGENGAAFRLRYDPPAQPHLLEVMANHRSVSIADVATAVGWEPLPGAEGARSWLGVPLVAGDQVIGLCSLTKDEAGGFTAQHVRLAEALAGQAAVVIQNAGLFEQVRAGRERMQSLSRRLVEVQESERRYIARELHDEAGQALASLMFGLRLLERERDLTEPLNARVLELKKIADSVLENLHRLAMDLRPASLDHLGLVEALRQYVKSLEDDVMKVQFKAVGFGDERLPPEMEIALYRIVQEALTNVVRHAQAGHIDVLLEQREGKVVAVVEDDGVGYDPEASRGGSHLGLTGMQERAEMLGGTLEVESAPGLGTTVVVEVPYANPHSHRR